MGYTVGFMGLGKLGLPTALAVESKGHRIIGHDISFRVRDMIESRKLPYIEAGAQQLLDKTQLKLVGISELVEQSDMILVPIQTPNDPRFEGTIPLPEDRADFDYSYLKTGMKTLSDEIARQGNVKIVAIISTVLPTTIEREIKPIIGSSLVKLCYQPFFIAMGTTIPDFLNPEIVLLGVDDEQAADVVEQFYHTIHDRPVYRTSIKNAEAIKVFYNTWISTKIAFANTVMEMSHKLGCDCDEIMNALFMCNDRIISTKYMRGGLGDAGGCHIRDNNALSYLSRKLHLSADWFGHIIATRERQTEWIADLVEQELSKAGKRLPIVLLGTAYKPNINLEFGSCGLLLKNILQGRGYVIESYDPFIDGPRVLPTGYEPAIFLIGIPHDEFKHYDFPAGSVVIDPWRFINPDKPNIRVIQVGRPQPQKIAPILD